MSPYHKTPASVPFVLRLTPNQLAVLKALAAQRGVPVPTLMREALSKHIPDFPEQGERNRFVRPEDGYGAR